MLAHAKPVSTMQGCSKWFVAVSYSKERNAKNTTPQDILESLSLSLYGIL